MNNEAKKGMVILDVDGVLNSYSNRKFYAQFIYKSLRELSKVHGKRALLKNFPKLKRLGGANALFVFAKEFCGDEKKFETYKKNLITKLNFDTIEHDPSMKKFIERLGNYGDVCIRSDGLGDVSAAVWDRIVNNKSSAQIKLEIMKNNNANTFKTVDFNGKNVLVSGIEDNDFTPKTNADSWKKFSDKYNVDISKSVLLDDSKKNTQTAKLLGMTTVHISVLDSFLQNSAIGTVFKCSLADILGEKISKSLKSLQISYGSKVDVKTLFKTILQGNDKNNKSIKHQNCNSL